MLGCAKQLHLFNSRKVFKTGLERTASNSIIDVCNNNHNILFPLKFGLVQRCASDC